MNNLYPSSLIRRPGREPKYPFPTMELGTSFTIPSAKAPQFHAFRIYCYTRNNVLKPKRFTCILNLDGSITITRRS
jgi:hypothetical protein